MFNQARLDDSYTAVQELHTTGPGIYDEVEWGVDWIDDATGNENYRTDAAVWDGSYQLGDEKLEKLDNYQAGATTIYEAHVAADTYDEAEWGVIWQNGDGENNYITNAGAWDGSYAVGIKIIQVQPGGRCNAVYVRNTNVRKLQKVVATVGVRKFKLAKKIKKRPTRRCWCLSANYIHDATELIAKPSGALRGQQTMELISLRRAMVLFSRVIFFKIQMFWKNLQMIQAL